MTFTLVNVYVVLPVLRVLPVRHTPIFWNKMAATYLLTAEVVSVFIFVVVNTA